MKGALIPLDKLPLPRGTDGNSMHWLVLPTLGANCRERVFAVHLISRQICRESGGSLQPLRSRSRGLCKIARSRTSLSSRNASPVIPSNTRQRLQPQVLA